MDIQRFLPINEYNAAIGANFPSAANVFATINDLSSFVSGNIYTTDGTLSGNRTIDANSNNVAFINVGGWSVNASGNLIFASNALVKFICPSGRIELDGKTGVKTSTPVAELTVKALSNGTDQAFAVRDNVDSLNLFSVLGNGQVNIGNPVSSASKVHIKGNDLGIALRVDADNVQNMIYIEEYSPGAAFMGIATNTQINNSRLSVNGNVSTSGVMSIGNAGIFGSAFSMPDNYNIVIGGTNRFGVTSSTTVVDAGSNNEILFRDAADRTYGKFDTNMFEITSVPTNVGSQIQNEVFNIYSQYWDGAVTQLKQAQIKHNITAAPSGTSQLDFSIGGVLKMTLTQAGDIETLGNTNGLVVLDRTDTNRYRIYTDAGVLYTELVP